MTEQTQQLETEVTQGITIRLPISVKDLYQAQADRERRPLGAYIRLLLVDLAQSGSVPPSISLTNQKAQPIAVLPRKQQ